MWLRSKRAFLIFPGLLLLTGALYGGLRAVNAQDSSPWLQTAVPSLAKIISLSDNVLPDSRNVDCSSTVYTPAGEQDGREVCAFASPLGTLTAEGDMQVSATDYRRISGPTTSSSFLPTVNSSIAVVTLGAPQIGDHIGVYKHLSKADLQQDIGSPDQGYYVTTQPDQIIRNPTTHEPLQISPDSIAYSANSEWMVANMPKTGLVRVNMSDLSVHLFAPPIEPDWYLGLAVPPLAISNDGRYVAANTDLFGGGNLYMYDLSTCDDQMNVAVTQRKYCTGKDIWHDLLKAQPDLERPTHLRFISGEAVSFSALYGREGVHYKAATFMATAAGAAEHMLGLLGMGDSYISGQGTFSYLESTDTAMNPCHVSQDSYPFVLGAKSFNSYNSVACSGAITGDVVGRDAGYMGQTLDKIPANKRDESSILANFLPGYIYQQEFASTYRPEAILLSVGGDDIGFADIVKSCVANQGGGTCYATYEDRVELLNEINAIYPKLVNTYATLQQQSGGARLYVVGYPQIAMPGGSCGLNVHLNEEEIEFSAQLISYLDGVVRQAAQTTGVSYVDTEHAFDGHRLCEPGSKAMNGLTAGGDAGVTVLGHTINFVGAESYHPTVLGYSLLAQAIAAQTSNLSAVMPTPKPYSMPQLNPSEAMLQNAPKTGRKVSAVTNDNTMASGFVTRGDIEQVVVDGAETQLEPGSAYQVVLHSDPILLAEGSVDAAGNITAPIHIPDDVAPGYHVLHVYANDMAGGSVDIHKVMYVAASSNDYDGDGLPNSANPCVIVALSGQDVDRDGLDDACDPDISLAPLGTAATNKIMVDSGVATAATADDASATPAVSSVLGDSVTNSNGSFNSRLTDTAISPDPQKLFRLNWWIVLGIGIMATLTATGLYYCIGKS